MDEMARSPRPVVELMVKKMTSTHGVPFLENFVRKTLFKDLEFSVPDWDMAALKHYAKINMKYRKLVNEHNKLVYRINRPKSELKVTKNQHRFLQEKLKDIELAVEKEDWLSMKV